MHYYAGSNGQQRAWSGRAQVAAVIKKKEHALPGPWWVMKYGDVDRQCIHGGGVGMGFCHVKQFEICLRCDGWVVSFADKLYVHALTLSETRCALFCDPITLRPKTSQGLSLSCRSVASVRVNACTLILKILPSFCCWQFGFEWNEIRGT
jgi:hypothetical protein